MNRGPKLTEQINIRLEKELLDEIQAWRDSIRPRPPLGAAARELLIEGLKAIKAQAEKPEKPAKGRKA
jgi:hypothetical protein